MYNIINIKKRTGSTRQYKVYKTMADIKKDKHKDPQIKA